MADTEHQSKVPLLPFFAGALACAGLTGVLLTEGPEAGTAAERARFMLECVQDFQYTPATCREVLEGADPPQRADAMGHPGC